MIGGVNGNAQIESGLGTDMIKQIIIDMGINSNDHSPSNSSNMAMPIEMRYLRLLAARSKA